MNKGALISECGKFRYRLWRQWSAEPSWVFVMLNPSTADAEHDDPTIRKCIGFAERNGAGRLDVVNLYAYRATKPADLRESGYQVGPDNDGHILDAVLQDDATIVCAWGSNARKLVRPVEVMAMLRREKLRPMSLKVTPHGVPWHPLYLPNDSVPMYL